MRPLLDRLRAGDLVVGDGAWGTMLIARGLRPGTSPESYNLERPEVLEEIASRYLEAGAEIVTTNTFGGSPLRLQPYRLEHEVERINRAAVTAVRRAAGERAYVSASIGPSGQLLKPFGDAEPSEIAESFAVQAGILAEAGVDLFCVETMTDLAEARLAVAAARAAAPDLPIIATMTFEPTRRGFRTVMGVSIEEAAAGLGEAGADILGSNCGNGIEAMVPIAQAFRACTVLPLSVRANAGLPDSRQGVLVYPESPEFFAERVARLRAAGVQIIGGCCGTTPEHVRAMRHAADATRAAGAT
jgi:5-methyltetrahydrofolate--homocysteine methyltransferase